MLLTWWRTPLLATAGWEYYHLLYFTIGPLVVFLTWTFLAPQATGGDAAAARAQYFDKAPQAFGGLALVSAWAIGATIWFADGAEVATSSIGWAVALAFKQSAFARRRRGVRLAAAHFGICVRNRAWRANDLGAVERSPHPSSNGLPGMVCAHGLARFYRSLTRSTKSTISVG
jgi:hypothetical protein